MYTVYCLVSAVYWILYTAYCILYTGYCILFISFVFPLHGNWGKVPVWVKIFKR